jgi:O-antigen/teichoic acid export membrane protein
LTTAQRILKNTFSLLFSGILSQVLSLIVVIYLARVLGPGDFGKINFTTAMITYFTVITNLGLSVLGAREIARHREQIKDYLRAILSVRWWLTVLSFGVLLLLAFFVNKPLETKYLLLLYGLGLFPAALLPDWVFQGIEKMEHMVLGRTLSGIVYVSFVLWFVKTPKQLLLIPCFQFMGSLLNVIVLFVVLSRGVDMSGNISRRLPWGQLVRQALPIGLTSMMSMIIYYLDTVMLGFMKTDQDVGNYNAAYKIILLLITVIAAYHDSIFPVISAYYQRAFDSFITLQTYTTRLMVIVAIPLGVGGTILAKKLITFLYGVEYSQAIIAFQILIWACVFIFINTAYSRGLFATNQEKACFQIVTIQAVITVIGDILLIPPFGLVGASIATVLGEICGLVLYDRVLTKIITIPLYQYIGKPLLASVIMGLFLWLSLDWVLYLLILEGIVIFFGVLYLLKGITIEEITRVQKAIFRG